MNHAIKPNEIKKQIPDFVFQAINYLITLNYSNGYSKVFQKDIINKIVRDHNVERSEIFANKWLDVETFYDSAGWNVVYEKPCHWGGDTFESYFEFTAKK